MDALLRKHLWVADVAVIAISAVCAARATTALVESILSLPPGHTTVAVLRVPPVMALRAKRVEEIVARNIFCSVCRAGAEPRDVAVPPPLSLRLLAIMYAPPPAGRTWSIAVIRDEDAKAAGPFTVGSVVADAIVADIAETHVWLARGGGHRQRLDLLAPPAPRPALAAPAVDRPGVTRTGEHSFQVERATLDAWLGDTASLARIARAFPELREGRVVGFRLSGIRPGGPFAQLGLRDGDVVRAINGIQMTSAEHALEAYTKLARASHISVALERGGRRVALDYDIQ